LDLPSLTEAATLAKADLTTELVKEFTELQGVIGGLYARAEGKPEVVWQAVYDQYLPAGVEGRVPRSVEGALLGIADRADTIAGLFGLGLEPTGSKDPFALRRAANAIVKMLAEMELPLTLDAVAKHAAADESTAARMRLFFNERLSFYLRDVRGFAYDVVTAVLVAGASDVRDAVARGEAVSRMRESADFLAVSAAFKRMKNILEQAIAKGESLQGGEALGAVRQVPEQAALAEASNEVSERVREAAAKRAYVAALEAMATLRPHIDAFFDKVMVMDPDPEVRASRLALISRIVGSFSGIADFSEIVTSG
ncbi:MAG TPA: glycine--tRNA ligase subunit beta, partial [Acidobacteriaceae bacterium]|nr:glycine--tRNA ligase subunit beta [Acidobacteriaceae bacterium]